AAADGQRRRRDRHGDTLDLTDRCEHCDDPLPEGGTVRQVYCNRICKEAAKRARAAAATRAARAGNTCISCGAAIPVCRRGDTLFCTKACSDRVSYRRALGRRRAEAREGRACVTCGGPIPVTLRQGTKHCGKECRDKADRQQR